MGGVTAGELPVGVNVGVGAVREEATERKSVDLAAPR